MIQRLLYGLFSVLIVAGPALAYWRDYLPVPLQHMKKLAQRNIPNELGDWSHDWKIALKKGVCITNNDHGGLTITGSDGKGKWAIETPGASIFKSGTYGADVDGNGVEDVIVCTYTGMCGLLTTRLLIVMFDKDGTPHPYQIEGYFSFDKRGIDDLFSNPYGCGAILVQQNLASGQLLQPIYKPFNQTRYWRWSAFRATDCKLKPITGDELGVKMPCFVWFTKKPNRLLSRDAVRLEQEFRQELQADGTTKDFILPPVKRPR